uniref:Uncharacterized protein n=1 Tax=Rangifer tarandus platyrhynchus TaxID=3082113 RepID=A0ACB0F6W7_RANTA|nr:unnamed protein product [Rangifer tarandus platyrhynchus]
MDTDTRAAWAEEGPSEDTATCKPLLSRRQAVGADGTGAHPRESAPQTRSPRPLNPPGPRLDAPVLPAPYLPRSRIPERHPFTPLPPPRTRCQVP